MPFKNNEAQKQEILIIIIKILENRGARIC